MKLYSFIPGESFFSFFFFSDDAVVFLFFLLSSNCTCFLGVFFVVVVVVVVAVVVFAVVGVLFLFLDPSTVLLFVFVGAESSNLKVKCMSRLSVMF